MQQRALYWLSQWQLTFFQCFEAIHSCYHPRVANDSLPPPIGRTSGDKEIPFNIRTTTPIRDPIKLTMVISGLILILIALHNAQQPHPSSFSPYYSSAAVILTGAGTILLVLSAFLLRVRRHWAHFLMLFASLCLIAPCVVWLVMYAKMMPVYEGPGFGGFEPLVLGLILLICRTAAQLASGVCLVSGLAVLFIKTDSTGTLQERLPQRVALVGGPLVAAVLIILFLTGRPALSVHEIDTDSVAITSCLITASGDLVIPQNIEGRRVTSIGRYAFEDCSSLTSITIPDGVTTVGERAFRECISLTSITIPDSVTSIGDGAFEGCISLTSITIPDSVTSIGNYAFYECSSLTSITIPDSVTSIGAQAFEYCTSLTSITIPDGVTSIGVNAFNKCSSLRSITIPDGVTSIGRRAFSNCSGLASITIPGGVTNIGDNAFSLCSALTSITIPDSVTSIENSTFYACTSLTSITLPDSVTSIDRSTFNGCRSLTSITIPDSVTSIERSAFNGCSSLTSITIPDSVTSIGERAFYSCRSLATVTFLGNAPKVAGDAFLASPATIYRKPEAKGWEDTFAGRPVKLISEKP